MYVRFVFWLAIGLSGLALVLKIVIDEFFCDWNAARELRAIVRAQLSAWNHRRDGRAEDWMLALENRRRTQSNIRLVDQRREQLRQLASVEERLVVPAAPAAVGR
jgi:hypothetical protein